MALSRENSGHNYLVSLIILLTVIAVLAAAAFLLAYYLPGTFAGPPFRYETKELYCFEPWSFNLDQIEAEFPEGGLILPLYREDKQEAAIIFAEGEYRISEQPLSGKKPSGIFLVIDEKEFEMIRGCVILLPCDDTEAKQRMDRIYDRQPGLPTIWSSVVPLTFTPAAGSSYYYFISEKGERLLPPVLNEPQVKLYASLALYAALIAIILLMMTIFTLDHRPSRYWETLYQVKPEKTALQAAAAVALLALGGELLPLYTSLPEYSFLAGYLAAIVLIIFMCYKGIIDFWDTGLNRNALLNGYLIAVAAAFMFMIITRGVPRQFSLNVQSVGALLFSVFIIGLARELIWRGYIQTMLGRRCGATAGLLLTTLLAGLFHYAVVALGSPELLSYPYTMVELLVLAPGTALVSGYLYLRTENILCCALLHGFLLSFSSLINI